MAQDIFPWAQNHPTLFAYLSERTYEDGGERVLATLNLYFEEGRFKCNLSDRDLGRTLWVTGISPEDCLAQLEVKVCERDPDWRGGRPKAVPGKKGGKG